MKKFSSPLKLETERKWLTPGGPSGLARQTYRAFCGTLAQHPPPRKAAIGAQSKRGSFSTLSLSFHVSHLIKKQAPIHCKWVPVLYSLDKRFICTQFAGFDDMSDKVFVADDAECCGFIEQFLYACGVWMDFCVFGWVQFA